VANLIRAGATIAASKPRTSTLQLSSAILSAYDPRLIARDNMPALTIVAYWSRVQGIHMKESMRSYLLRRSAPRSARALVVARRPE
jgi:hypothetical protein